MIKFHFYNVTRNESKTNISWQLGDSIEGCNRSKTKAYTLDEIQNLNETFLQDSEATLDEALYWRITAINESGEVCSNSNSLKMYYSFSSLGGII